VLLEKKPVKHCGLGKKLIEGKCVSVVKPIVCPKGYHRHGKHRCVKVVNCPKGFTKVQFGCKKVVINCPPGYTKHKNSCKKVTRKCARGYQLVGKKCERFRKSKCGNTCPRVACARGFYKKHFKHLCCARCVSCKCPREFDPVCTKNGITFKNSCDAKCQGFEIKNI